MKLHSLLVLTALIAWCARPASAENLENYSSDAGQQFDANRTAGGCRGNCGVQAGEWRGRQPRLETNRSYYRQQETSVPTAPAREGGSGMNWGVIGGIAGAAVGLLAAPWLGIPLVASGLMGAGIGSFVGGKKTAGLGFAGAGIGAWAAVGLFSAGPVGMVAGGLLGAAVGLFAGRFFNKPKSDA